MKRLSFLLRKEFRQILRNPFILRAIIAVPLVQMLILVPAVTLEMKKIDLAVVDDDRSPASRELVSRLTGSSFFVVAGFPGSVAEAETMLFSGKADMALVIPADFSRGVAGITPPRLQVLADAVNATTAQLSWNYLLAVVRNYNLEVLSRGLTITAVTGSGDVRANTYGPMRAEGSASLPRITTEPRYWYNPTLNYKYFMLPGILVILITAIGLLMSGLNLVREKEMGTIEQINVTPVRKWELISAKMIPFFIIGLVDLILGLTIGWLAFSIPFEGSLLLFFACASIFLVAVLGLALFFSTMASSQQQFLFISFFVMLIFILMSGIFTPAGSMPLWAQQFNRVNPVAYLISINRMVMLKGSGFADIASDMGMLSLLAALFLTLAIRTYRKRV